MVLLSVGFASGKYDVYAKLKQLTNFLRKQGISIGLVESDSDEMHFIKCIVSDENLSENDMEKIKEKFDIYAANTIYQIIMDNFQIDIIKKILKENHSYFKPAETSDIIAKCMGVLDGSLSSISGNYFYSINFKDKAVNKIYDYISDNNEIILEGFYRFRLKELNSDLEDFVDKIVEEYLIEREYNEFIKLLKYFVEIQESRVEVVNIVASFDGSYCIYDTYCKDITDEFLKDLSDEGMSGEISCDDLLVSSLITLAPKIIIIHNISAIKNKEVVETIKNVFTDRVKVCPGCSLCVNNANKI